MTYCFRNLIFEGVRCAAYAGAMLALQELGMLGGITRVGGTSAGVIAALMVGLRFPPENMAAFLYRLDFSSLRDRSLRGEQDLFRLATKYGWYRGKSVTITGFGTFSLADRKERLFTHPITKERTLLPAYQAPIFRYSQRIRDKFKDSKTK